jgi:hypothetical protein
MVSAAPSRIDQLATVGAVPSQRIGSWHNACTSGVGAQFGRLEDSMRTRISLAVPAAILALAACASVDVRTVTSPDANLAALRTFNVMPNPNPRPEYAQSTNDPMLVNSISNRALRADLVTGFENRGYVLADKPDFAVAYYASTQQKLDVTYWDYGYPFYPEWYGGGFGPGPYSPTVSQYTQGTVIVDVINPNTKELLWRGQGVATVSDNQAQYEQDLWKTVTAILDKFPQARSGS